MKTFEDKKTQKLFERYGGEKPYGDFDEFLYEDLELLGRADRIVPVKGWFGWRETLHIAADQYRREKITEAIPQTYEQYQMSVDLKLAFAEPETPLNSMTGITKPFFADANSMASPKILIFNHFQ